MFEVIQSHSDSLYRRVFVGTGSWSKKSPGGSASQTLFGIETPLKFAPQTEETTPGDDFCEIIQRTDCATRTTTKRSQAIRLSNVSQLASLKTDGIKVLIASLPANYPLASILLP